MPSVWVVGSLNIDLVAKVRRFPQPGETVGGADLHRRPGGKGANQAAAAAAAGATVRLVASVGDDETGRSYLDELNRRGVDVSGVLVRHGTPTGHALILVDETGENTIVVIPGANGLLTAADLSDFAAAPGDVVLLQLETPVEVVTVVIERARSAGATVILNLSPYRELDARLLECCDPIVVNEMENAQLEATGTKHESVVVTRGSAGASWGDAHAVAAAERVVDTTGAGDAFAGTLAAALAMGKNRQAALSAAVVAGALAVEHDGAQDWEF